jgi:hypothetical protein
MTIDRRAIRVWTNKVRDILNREWDPIGDCPENEYDTYAHRLASMIHHDATDDDLMRYLEDAEVHIIGLGPPFDIERGRRVISALRLLGTSK